MRTETMQIVLASRNAHKKAELQALLSEFLPDIRVLSLDDVGITEEIVEDGSTFEENALIKARAAARSGYIGVGDDSGLTVEALNGEPGIYSARYAETKGYKDSHNDRLNNAVLLDMLKNNPDRKARFVCCIACVFPGRESEPVCVRGTCDGVILEELRGDSGFGYDPLFYIPSLGRTFAQLSPEEKNKISHRGRAVRAFALALKQRIEEDHGVNQ
ncbi:MAG: RdgB/HAM1 family non-canonical purine NTP pyrophosphatase [Clostridia bacterium]|nr:RdgB/HAM1 family non-canonical purine NTP pyrophosphatase [Clostridia bacterium]MBQ7727482.1 RdgB/HAM1 family non-canonical purine NTP pyrophosphatase [Clostridia bacterium]